MPISVPGMPLAKQPVTVLSADLDLPLLVVSWAEDPTETSNRPHAGATPIAFIPYSLLDSAKCCTLGKNDKRLREAISMRVCTERDFTL